jgi:hypothetical protein
VQRFHAPLPDDAEGAPVTRSYSTCNAGVRGHHEGYGRSWTY